VQADEYVAERLLDQLAWYEKASSRKRLQHLVLGGAALIATVVVTATAALELPSWSVAAIGGSAAGLLGIHGFLGPVQDWMRYRDSAERLKSERFRYETRTGAYAGIADEEVLTLLVDRVEEILSSERQSWLDQGQGRSGPQAGQ